MSSPTDDELARWRALADAATPGPWTHEGTGVITASVAGRGRQLASMTGQVATYGDLTRPAHEIRDANAELTAAAREAIPRLLDEVARLRAMTLAVSVDRDTLESERDDARREAETLRSQLESARDLHTRMMHEIHEAAGVRPDGLAAILAWIEGARELADEVERLRSEVAWLTPCP